MRPRYVQHMATCHASGLVLILYTLYHIWKLPVWQTPHEFPGIHFHCHIDASSSHFHTLHGFMPVHVFYLQKNINSELSFNFMVISEYVLAWFRSSQPCIVEIRAWKEEQHTNGLSSENPPVLTRPDNVVCQFPLVCLWTDYYRKGYHR